MKANKGLAIVAIFLVGLASMGQLTSNAPFFREARIGKAEIDSDGDISTPGAISAASFSAPAAGATNVNAGVDDTTQGTVSVFGDGTTGGGILGIYNGAGADGTIEYWRWVAHTDGTLKMQRVAPGPTTTDWLTVSTGGVPTFAGVITSSVTTGTAPFSVASTTVVPNLNVSQLLGGTWASPGAAIGTGTAVAGTFTGLSVGADDTTAGVASLFGNTTTTGGFFNIYNGANTDSDVERWIVGAGSGDGNFRIRTVGGTASSEDVFWITAATTRNATFRYGITINGNGAFGDASTDTFTFTGRAITRDVNDADMVNVPGTTGEIVRNTADTPDKAYFCTVGDVSNATWVDITAGSSSGQPMARYVEDEPDTINVSGYSVVTFDSLDIGGNTIATISGGTEGQRVTLINDDATTDVIINTSGNVYTGTTLSSGVTPSTRASYVFDGTGWHSD